MKLLALIPARSGSVRLPNKNIADLNGQPLIAHTIAAALASQRFDRVVVSTDSDEYASIARAHGAETPFLRPPELSTGHPSLRTAATEHALNWLRIYERYEPDGVVLLQPTSPLRTAQDICGALDRWQATGADACVAVTEAHARYATPLRYDESTHRLTPTRVPPDDALAFTHTTTTQSSALEMHSDAKVREGFHVAQGSLYCISPTVFIAPRSRGLAPSFFPPSLVGYAIPASRSLDIDTAFDLHLARLLLAHPYVDASDPLPASTPPSDFAVMPTVSDWTFHRACNAGWTACWHRGKWHVHAIGAPGSQFRVTTRDRARCVDTNVPYHPNLDAARAAVNAAIAAEVRE